MYASSRSRARGDRDLRREAQVAEDVPDPRLGVFLPELFLDDLGHPFQGPQVRSVSVGEGPLEEELAETLALLGIDLPGPAGVLCFSPRVGALGAQALLPRPHRLVGHIQPSSNLGLGDPPPKPAVGQSAAFLSGRDWGHGSLTGTGTTAQMTLPVRHAHREARLEITFIIQREVRVSAYRIRLPRGTFLNHRISGPEGSVTRLVRCKRASRASDERGSYVR